MFDIVALYVIIKLSLSLDVGMPISFMSGQKGDS